MSFKKCSKCKKEYDSFGRGPDEDFCDDCIEEGRQKNKSNDKRTKKPKTQIKKKLRLVNLFINCYILNYSTVTN